MSIASICFGINAFLAKVLFDPPPLLNISPMCSFEMIYWQGLITFILVYATIKFSRQDPISMD